MTRILTPLLLICIALSAQGQNVPFHCGAGEFDRVGDPVVREVDFPQRVAQANNELESFTQQYISDGERGGGSGYVIPIVFHIVHNNGPENITDAQVRDAVRILNDDFNRLNPDWDNVRAEFQDIVSDVGVEFRLATKDPNGNCTNGITRTVSALTNEGASQMKALISWPRNKYLQVWVAASADGAAGYTFRPGSAAFFASEDGIVMQHLYVGAIGTGAVSRSRALTHEVGHWLNLLHTWGDGNDPAIATNCNMDDNVSDTPNTIGWTSCSLNGTTCGSLDNVENYMDYSYCSKMFTEGQATRMIAALNSTTAQRNQVWQLSNLINTGVNGNATLCAAQFSSNSGQICAGGTVQFTDESYHNVSTRNWAFPGGTPATSSEADPLVTYTESGTYSVTLQVSDGSGTLSTTTQNLVVVAPNPGQAPPVVESFEGSNQFPDHGWAVENPDNDNGFTITTTAAYTGSQSARLQNSGSMAGRIDNLITPTVDMSSATDILVTFRYAYARRTSSNDDRLRVYVSNTCGETWSLRKQMYASSTLNTGGVITSNFIPNGPDQWGYEEITTISDTYHVSDLRLRFEFQSDGGNNFYLDDVNINGMPVGLEEVLANGSTSLMVVPNPATSASQAVVNIPSAGQTRIELLDVLGRTVKTLHNGTLVAGHSRFELPVADLTSGLYFVRMQQGIHQEVARFVVR
jgi:PKD repeat protein